MKKATCGILFGLLIMAAFSVQAGEKPAKVDDASIQQYLRWRSASSIMCRSARWRRSKRKGSPTKSWRWSFSSPIVPVLKPAPVIELRRSEERAGLISRSISASARRSIMCR